MGEEAFETDVLLPLRHYSQAPGQARPELGRAAPAWGRFPAGGSRHGEPRNRCTRPAGAWTAIRSTLGFEVIR